MSAWETEERRGDGIPVEGIDAGEGILEGGEGGKIALAHGDSGHVGREEGSGDALQSVEIEKEKRLVAADGTARGAAVVVQVLEGLGGGEGVARIGGAVAEVPEQAAVQGVGTGFGGGGHGAHAAEFGARGEQVGGEFLNGFDGRLGHVVRAAEVAEGGFDAVHLDFDAGSSGAGGEPLGAVADLHDAGHGEGHDAGDEAGIAGVFGDAAQVGGRLDDLAGREAAADVGRFELYDGRGGFGDDDFGGCGCHFELEVLADGAVGFDGEGAGFDGTEAFGVGQQAVGSGGQVGKGIGAGAIGDGGAADAGVIVGEGHGCGGNGAAGGIDGEPGHRAERRLGVQDKDTDQGQKELLESHKGTFIVSQCASPILWNCKVETVIRSRFHPVRDAAIGAGAVLLFAWFAELAARAGPPVFDAAGRDLVHGYAARWLTSLMIAASWAGSGFVLWPLGALIVLLMARAGREREGALFAVAVVGANLISESLKLFFHRVRPEPWFGYPLPNPATVFRAGTRSCRFVFACAWRKWWYATSGRRRARRRCGSRRRRVR